MQGYAPEAQNNASVPYGQDQQEPPPPAGAAAQPKLAQRFAEANVARDGMLTLQQAEQANWRVVVRNFGAIDVARKGYVTLDDIRSWLTARRRPPLQQPG